MTRFIRLLILLFYCCSLAHAQKWEMADSTDFLEVNLEQIGVNQGLSQGLILSLVEDRSGYIWVGTQDGLNRYDGTRFRVFQNQPGDSTSLAGNYIRKVLVDSKNRIWVVHPPFGIGLFNRETESFIRFPHAEKPRKGCLASMIVEIAEDRSGNIFALSETGTQLFTITQKANTSGSRSGDFVIQPARNHPLCQVIEKTNYVTYYNLSFQQDGGIWYTGSRPYFIPAGSKNGPFPAFRKPSLNVISSYHNSKLLQYPEGNQTYRIESLSRLSRFNAKTKIFEPFLNLPKPYQFWNNFRIDPWHRLWVWSSPNRILRIDLNTRKITVINPNKDRLEKVIQNNEFFFQAFDQMGNIWMGTTGFGIIKISGQQEKFRHKSSPVFNNQRFSTAKDHSFFDPNLNISMPRWRKTILSEYTAPNTPIFFIKVLTIARSGRLVYALLSVQHAYYKLLESDPSGANIKTLCYLDDFSNDFMGATYFTDAKDNIWFGEHSTHKGTFIYEYERASKKVKRYLIHPNIFTNTFDFIFDWYWDGAGNLWLATRKGLIFLDPKTGKVSRWEHEPNNPSSLSINELMCICPDPVDPGRFLWLGTNGAGMQRFDRQKGTFDQFSTKNGLPNNVVYGIQTDVRNNLWLSTNMGLCRFEPKTGNTTNYTIEDGLISNEFNRREFSKGPDGTLYFSGPSGDTWFNPEDFYKIGKASSIYFNELRIGNKPVEFSNLKVGGFQLTKPIEQTEKLEFTHDQSMITLGFALMDLTNREVNRFRYKMEGFDKEWIDAGKFSEATYTNLSPGEYTFNVIGCNSRKVWNTQPKTLAITILPPWWGTWWFRFLVVMFVGGMIYALYRYRLKQALKMMRLRDKIALDLHDEIGSSLNSIAFFGEAARQMIPEDAQANQVISRINDKSKEIMESMSDIVWSLNSRNDSFDNIFNRLQSFAFQMLEPKGCQIEFDLADHKGDIKLGMEERKNLYLLIKEAINNAAKYASCSELLVRVEKKNQGYRIEVRDNGKGFDQEKTAGGNGLVNMHKRAEALGADFSLESTPGTGTRILVDLKYS